MFTMFPHHGGGATSAPIAPAVRKQEGDSPCRPPSPFLAAPTCKFYIADISIFPCRLYSEYLFFKFNKEKGPNDFHDRVKEAVDIFSKCLERNSTRQCAYDVTLKAKMKVSIILSDVKDTGTITLWHNKSRVTQLPLDKILT